MTSENYSLRKSALAAIMTTLILVTLFSSYNKADTQLTQEFVDPVKNWSFEDRDMPDPYIPNDGVYECPPWETNNGGWRELPGDVDGDGEVDLDDLYIVMIAYGTEIGDPNFDPAADIDGDGIVDIDDLYWVLAGYGEVTKRIDGSYSQYTSGGGDYQMWQWLDIDFVKAVAGEKVEFSFYFYPESVTPDGSQNNARAEIYYEYSGGSNTVNGSQVLPTELNWWNTYVTANLPSTTYAMKVIIHGKPDFKAWVDLAQFAPNLYVTYPPYENQGTYPASGTCIVWMNAKICVIADSSTGQASAYSWDASSIGTGREAYAQFNRDPPPGNSPVVYEEDDFSVGAYWVAYGYLGTGGPSYSDATIKLYVYYSHPYYGWQHVRTYEWWFDSWDYPNQEIYYSGSVSAWISSPPSGSGYYTVVARARTYAVNFDGSAVADFLYYPYYMFIGYIKMSD